VLLDGRYDVVTATDGREALRLIEECSVDLVVSDVLMPLVAGEELVEAARRAGVRIPVILISGTRSVSSARGKRERTRTSTSLPVPHARGAHRGSARRRIRRNASRSSSFIVDFRP
jgi:DNA-binding NtrC family response regulator